MAGPRSSVSSKRKRQPEVVTAPVPRRPRRDNPTVSTTVSTPEPTTDPEKTTNTATINNDTTPTAITTTTKATITTTAATSLQQEQQQEQLPPSPENIIKPEKNTALSVDDDGESSSCVVEHDEDEEQRPKTLSLDEQNKKQEAAEAAAASSSSSKEALHLQELVSHRKVLLERIRQGRKAAQKRLDQIYEQDPKRKDESEEEDVANFKEMCRIATSLARKQQAGHGSTSETAAGGGAGPAESSKRTSLSLRRGSSVGKRMNAALSTLSGITATTTTVGVIRSAVAAPVLASESSATATLLGDQPQSIAVTQQQQVPGGKVVAVKAPAMQLAPPPTTGIAAPTGVETATALNSQPGGGGLLLASKPLSLSATTPRVATTMGRPPKKSMQQQQEQSAVPNQQQQRPQKRPLSATGGASRSGSVSATKGGRQPQSSMQQQPQHQQLSAAAAAAGARAAQQHPVVICPEAIALRERRNVLEKKLTHLFRKRRDGVLISSAPPVASSSSATANSAASVSQQASPLQQQQQPIPKEIPPKVLASALKGPPCAHSPQQPYVCPPRRKTHWDYVLEEMRWLATDFIEERKWKIVAARHVAAVAVSHGRATLSPREGGASLSVSSAALLETTTAAGSQTRTEILTSDIGGGSEHVEQRATEVACDLDKGSASDHGGKGIGSYADVSAEDLVQAKEVASIVSSMIRELAATVVTAGVANPESKDDYAKALERHILARNRLNRIREPKPDRSGDAEMTDATPTVVSPTENGEAEAPNSDIAVASASEPSSFDDIRPGAEKEKVLRRISEFVDSVVAKVESETDAKPKNSTNSLKLPFTASSGQLSVMERVEDLWLRASAGAVLGGPVNSGKTLVTCALLWKLRLDGPQLIVCSPLSMIRWMHEIGRFDGINRRARAMDAGISSPVPRQVENGDYQASDIVVCEFAALSTFTAEELSTFRSIVIDSRHPNGFFGSRAPVYEELESFFDSGVGGMETPPELLSTSWWTQLSGCVQDSQLRRLLIESSSPSQTLRFFCGMPDRPLLEVLALRLAFLLGASGFQWPGFSLAKCVLAWARRKIKNTEGKGTKFERIRGFIVSLTESFYCEIEDAKVLDEVGLGVSTSVWDLCLCKMPEEQSVAYDKLCRESRAALSMTLDASNRKRLHVDPLLLAADYLFRLRQLCLHSDPQTVLSDSPLDAVKKMLGGSSQPNYHLAARILKGSGKLRELLSILVYDCDVNVDDFEFLEPFLRQGGRKTTTKGKQKEHVGSAKRIIVLASLPEAQLLVSLLLNSVCIEHDSFLRPVALDRGKGVGSLEVELQAMAWAGSQLILSRFNDEQLEFSTKGRCSFLVVASIEAIAGDSCGLGVELADLIICLDEDWSGRGELQMKSLVGRCLSRRRSSKGDTCRFIKLITADSCEHSFLSRSGGNTKKKQRQSKSPQKPCWPWPIEAYGSFSAKQSFEDADARGESWSNRSPGKDCFAFPASNVMTFRDEELSSVLSLSGNLPPLFSIQGDMLFLPLCHGVAADLETEMLFAACLMKRETHSSFATSWGQIRPPQPLHSPQNIGRLDLAVLPSRFHLQRLNRHVAAMQHPTTLDVFAAPLPIEVAGFPFTSEPADAMDVSAGDSPSRRAENSIESFLFYGCNPVNCDDSNRRINAYSSLFSTWNLAGLCVNGNSGAEPLVYFPPLFPRLLACSEAAHLDIASLQARRPVDASTNKRMSDSLSLPMLKRPRLESDSFTDLLALNGPDEAILLDISLSNEKAAVEPGLITEDEASQNDAVSVLLDLSGDYGVVGIGAVPLPRDSAQAAASVSVTARPVRSENNGEWWADRFPCDSEEAQWRSSTALDSMILFVSRKRPRGFTGYPTPNNSALSFQRLQSGAPIWASGINAQGEFNDFYYDVNGAGKKPKKKLLNQKETGAGVSAFNRLSVSEHSHPLRPLNHVQTIMPVPKSRDIYRSRLLMRLRQSSGNNLFDAPSFRKASTLVRQRIADRLDRNGWTSGSVSESGSGMPFLSSKEPPLSFPGRFQGDAMPWTSIVKHLKSESAMTGDEAVELSEAQAVAFRRSHVTPCRVDFGPFHSGFFCSVSGMTSVAPIRPRLGVSLPMGVKLPAQRDLVLPSWSRDDSELLRRIVGRFGMNWVLASRVLNGFQDIPASSNSTLCRSPRTCRDHWQKGALEGGETVKATRNFDSGSRHEVNKADLSGSALALVCGTSSFLLPSSRPFDYIADNDANLPSDGLPPNGSDDIVMDEKLQITGKEKTRRSFDRIMAAKAKQQSVPISIPGIASGSPPALVASHPSHMQAVQSSVASSWSNGRTEMWPLQLLDAADRQRASLTTTTAPVTSVPVQSQSTVPRTPSLPPPPGSNSGARLPAAATTTGAVSSSTTSQRSSFTRVQPPPGANHSSAPPPPSNASSSVTPHEVGPTPRTAPQSRASSSIQSFIPPTQPPATTSAAASQSSPADRSTVITTTTTKDSFDPKPKS